MLDREISAQPTSPPQLSAIALYPPRCARKLHPNPSTSSILNDESSFVSPSASVLQTAHCSSLRVCQFHFPFPGASSRRSNPVRHARDATRAFAHLSSPDFIRIASTQLCATAATEIPSSCRLSAASAAALAPTTTPTPRAPALAGLDQPTTITPVEVSNMSFLFNLSLADLRANRPWSPRPSRSATPQTPRR